MLLIAKSGLTYQLLKPRIRMLGFTKSHWRNDFITAVNERTIPAQNGPEIIGTPTFQTFGYSIEQYRSRDNSASLVLYDSTNMNTIQEISFVSRLGFIGREDLNPIEFQLKYRILARMYHGKSGWNIECDRGKFLFISPPLTRSVSITE